MGLGDEIFHDPNLARAWLVKVRWPDGVVCPHCDSGERIGTRRPGGVYHSMGKRVFGGFYCNGCRQRHFSVLTKTFLAGTHTPLQHWLVTIFMMCSPPHGSSTCRISAVTGVCPQSVWSLMDRFRKAARGGDPFCTCLIEELRQ